MAKVTGFGGFFFKSADPSQTAAWMTDVLGLPTESWGRMFPWRDHDDPSKESYTVLGLHHESSDYFGPSSQPFMLNFHVDDLEGLLSDLEAKGVTVIKRFDPDPNGRFAHIAGPNGITIELWQPATDPEGS
jgi:lactoylglutathione lyase